MKVVILAGGLGTRLSEETDVKPKPMIEIGGKPILWHIMRSYSAHGINDFIVCAGYKGYVIKEYFANYFLHNSDVTFDLSRNAVEVHERRSEPWRVTVVDTGEETQTGGRLRRVAKYLDDETFCFTYGDGVSDVNIAELVAFHRQHRRLATVTAVQPPGRYGALGIDAKNQVRSFQEKPAGDGAWINGGFFVLEPRSIEYIRGGDATTWERQPLEDLARDGELAAYKHDGFWRPMDTLRDKRELEALWMEGRAPWRK
ncbi:MAG: glucose-1-phosphate cytidylyltransferase [Planctomycetota bacterium]|nr:MAG: glucose-1-phosphate cytidylyltransferase [Planctomycetota bacterium]